MFAASGFIVSRLGTKVRPGAGGIGFVFRFDGDERTSERRRSFQARWNDFTSVKYEVNKKSVTFFRFKARASRIQG